MRCAIVLLALAAFGAALPQQQQKQHAANQDLVKKQQDVIVLLQQVNQEIPDQQLQNLGSTYDIQNNLQQYNNPNLVNYYASAVQAGLVQPKGTSYSSSISQLRKEVTLLQRTLLSAKNYQTLLATAAWARVNVNEEQFVKAFIAVVLQHPETQGVILPPLYEIIPQFYFDTRIIQEIQNIVAQGVGQNPVVIPVNYTAGLANDEQQLSYFTQDIGLANYYAFVNLVGDLSQNAQQQSPAQFQGNQNQQGQNGQGAIYYYVHQQLQAHYELNRLANGLGPVQNINYDNVQAPYQPHLRHANGLEFPSRPSNFQFGSVKNNLFNTVRKIEQRLIEAIDSGHVITPQGAFLSLYQPQGLNILGELIQGTGKSVNPRYYGSLQAAARQLLGNAPTVQNIYDYTPSVLESGSIAVRDPAFYQLFNKVVQLFQQYQNSLPAYQYNDILVPGVSIQNVQISPLVTFFDDYYVDVSNAAIQQQVGQQQQQQFQQQQQQYAQQQQRFQQQQPQHFQQQQPQHFQQQQPQHFQQQQQNQQQQSNQQQQQPQNQQQQPNQQQQQNQQQQPQHQQQQLQNQQQQQQYSQVQQQQYPQQQQQPQAQQQQQIQAQVQRLDHKPYKYQITVQSEQNVPSVVVRVYLGPKFDYQGNPISISQHRQQFVEFDQFITDLQQGQNVIVRQSQQAPGQSFDYPSVQEIQQSVNDAVHAQKPFYITEPQQIFGFPARLALPKGQQGQGFPVQLFVVISQPGQQSPSYGPVIPEQFQTYQQNEYQVVGTEEYQQKQHQGNQGIGPQQAVEVVPENLSVNQQVNQVIRNHHANFYAQQYGQNTYAQSQGQGQVHGQNVYGTQSQWYGYQRQQGQNRQQQSNQSQGQQPWSQSQGQQLWSQTQGQNAAGVQGRIPTGVQGTQQSNQDVQGVQQVQGAQGNVGGIQSGIQSQYQSTYQGQSQQQQGHGAGYAGSGQSHAGGFQNVFNQGQRVQDSSVSQYYQNKPISQIIGGAISLDGKPFNYPLDRPLSAGALSVPNVYVQTAYIQHEDQPTNEVYYQ